MDKLEEPAVIEYLYKQTKTCLVKIKLCLKLIQKVLPTICEAIGGNLGSNTNLQVLDHCMFLKCVIDSCLFNWHVIAKQFCLINSAFCGYTSMTTYFTIAQFLLCEASNLLLRTLAPIIVDIQCKVHSAPCYSQKWCFYSTQWFGTSGNHVLALMRSNITHNSDALKRSTYDCHRMTSYIHDIFQQRNRLVQNIYLNFRWCKFENSAAVKPRTRGRQLIPSVCVMCLINRKQ